MICYDPTMKPLIFGGVELSEQEKVLIKIYPVWLYDDISLDKWGHLWQAQMGGQIQAGEARSEDHELMSSQILKLNWTSFFSFFEFDNSNDTHYSLVNTDNTLFSLVNTLNTLLSLVNTLSTLFWLVDSLDTDWSIQVMQPEHWPLIGWCLITSD